MVAESDILYLIARLTKDLLSGMFIYITLTLKYRCITTCTQQISICRFWLTSFFFGWENTGKNPDRGWKSFHCAADRLFSHQDEQKSLWGFWKINTVINALSVVQAPSGFLEDHRGFKNQRNGCLALWPGYNEGINQGYLIAGNQHNFVAM